MSRFLIARIRCISPNISTHAPAVPGVSQNYTKFRVPELDTNLQKKIPGIIDERCFAMRDIWLRAVDVERVYSSIFGLPAPKTLHEA
jgi:hypothetical protein